MVQFPKSAACVLVAALMASCTTVKEWTQSENSEANQASKARATASRSQTKRSSSASASTGRAQSGSSPQAATGRQELNEAYMQVALASQVVVDAPRDARTNLDAGLERTKQIYQSAYQACSNGTKTACREYSRASKASAQGLITVAQAGRGDVEGITAPTDSSGARAVPKVKLREGRADPTLFDLAQFAEKRATDAYEDEKFDEVAELSDAIDDFTRADTHLRQAAGG